MTVLDTRAAGAALLPVYAQMPVHPVRGHGSWLVGDQGTEWLGAYGGHAVASTGHSHPDVVKAIADQAARLLFYSAAVPHPLREELAERLAAWCLPPLGKVFFCNSGAEANEKALGIARKRTGRHNVVSVKGGWHGRTPGVLACTDGARYEEAARRAGIPLSTRVPFNDAVALEAVVDASVAAVIVEPVQGIQGARDCAPEFLRTARDVCTWAGAALIFDEIQCGVGRCGAFTAAEAYGVTPDIVTMAKGLVGIARSFQNIRLLPSLSVFDNVRLGAHIHTRAGLWSVLARSGGMRAEESAIAARIDAVLEFVGLQSFRDEMVRNLPYGRQKVLEIARALMIQPKLLLLDEPAAGLNSAEKQQLMGLVSRIRDTGVSILLIEHEMAFVEGLSDRVYVLNYGKKISQGTFAEIQRDPVVIEAYLGAGGSRAQD